MTPDEALTHAWCLWGDYARIRVRENVVCGEQFITQYDIGWILPNGANSTFSGDTWEEAVTSITKYPSPPELSFQTMKEKYDHSIRKEEQPQS